MGAVYRGPRSVQELAQVPLSCAVKACDVMRKPRIGGGIALSSRCLVGVALLTMPPPPEVRPVRPARQARRNRPASEGDRPPESPCHCKMFPNRGSPPAALPAAGGGHPAGSPDDGVQRPGTPSA